MAWNSYPKRGPRTATMHEGTLSHGFLLNDDNTYMLPSGFDYLLPVVEMYSSWFAMFWYLFYATVCTFTFILTVEQHEPCSKPILNYAMINPLNSAWNISPQQPLPLSSAHFNMGTILNWHLNYLLLLSNKFLHSATIFFKP